MIRLWFAYISVAFIILLLLTSGVIAASTLNPPSPMLAGFGYCEGKPCWLGIDMQSASVTDADRLLKANGYQTMPDSTMGVYQAPDKPCNVVINHEFGSETIFALQLINCHDLLFGDFMEVFGTPGSVGINGFCDWSMEYPAMFVYVDGQLVPGVGLTEMLPDRHIVQIDFNPLTVGMIDSTSWRGFAPLWRYRQFDDFGMMSFCP